MIKVTYIGHSGFWVEWPDCIWLFDYYEGKLPDVPPVGERLPALQPERGDVSPEDKRPLRHAVASQRHGAHGVRRHFLFGVARLGILGPPPPRDVARAL